MPNPANHKKEQNAPHLVLFDGVCALCDKTVQFLLSHDKKMMLRFAPLQGETAGAILKNHPEITEAGETVVFVENYKSGEKVFQRSDAILNIFRELGGIWVAVSWLRIIPRKIRDWVYDWIARNRYGWFGKYEECRLPGPEEKDRFLP